MSPNQTQEDQRRVVWSRLHDHRTNLAKQLSRERERYLEAHQALNPKLTQVKSSHDLLYRDNDISIKNTAPLPLIPELIDKLCRARYYTKFDIRWGYNNICIKEGDEWKAAFKTPLGLFEPTVMTFGLCNTPATFQTFMNNIFEDMINAGHVVVYLDDILIFAEGLTMLNYLSSKVLTRLKNHDLYLKPEKCSFAQTSIEYLGIIISEGQIKMDLAKVKGITDWLTPRTVKQVQAFLGFCNFTDNFDEQQQARKIYSHQKCV